MLLNQAPAITAAAAEALARELYGIDATASPLTSERDQNFRLDSGASHSVLKIANAAEDRTILEAQTAAMEQVAARTSLCPRVVPSVNGETITSVPLGSTHHFVRLLTWIPGEPLGAVPRHSPSLLADLGRAIGEVDRALASFDHPAIHRLFQWDLARATDVIAEHLPEIADAATRDRLHAWTTDIAHHLEPLWPALRRSAIHNDGNDYNVIVATDGDVWSRRQRIAGLIDFGDMVHTITVADLAIAAAYAVLDKPDPLSALASIVRGYHAVWPLTDSETAALFDLVRLRLCTSVAMAAYQQAQRPDDAYLAISQGPIARALPELMSIPRGLARAVVRHACGYDSFPMHARACRWLQTRGSCAPVVASDPATTIVLDLSVASRLISGDPSNNTEPALTARIQREMADAGAHIAIGRYGEPRLLYSTPLFAASVDGERRTIHLGHDYFAPAGTAVRAAFDGVVHAARDNAAPLDYGPVIILEHASDEGDPFYTLYGHLTRESLDASPAGRHVTAGEPFAAIGTADVNGGWTPHLHFQLIVDLLGLGLDYPGVCRPSERHLWQALSPDPSACADVAGGSFPEKRLDVAATLAERRERIGGNVSVGYLQPVKAVRGWMQYLYDQSGRRYLDAYNNVPHVGHSHPRVVEAIAAQTAVLNTNTRYLHDHLARLAERLTKTLPTPLRVCYFVNSGSEANELALRLARAHTRRRDLIVLESGYHGNTTTLIDVSHYKFAGPGGEGAPSWVHTVPVPDVYRGRFKANDPNAGAGYAAQVDAAIERLGGTGAGLCGFLAETCPSVAGQIVPPPGYFERVYASVRAAGGVCIADEVQTAYGRMGTSFYAFESHAVIPDIVVLGKPIGNGYPLGAVVTTTEIAESFDNGMEFFSTFGGSTVSCAAGLAVLDVVEEEQLQAHARTVGDLMIAGLRELAVRHEIIGDVRGSGLFLGVELVGSRDTLAPAAAEASFVVNRLREEGILLGTDGPLHNVLKIRPPMPFDADEAGRLIEVLDRIMAEIR